MRYGFEVLNPLIRPGALLATGLLAGTFFYATLNIVPAFWETPASVHLAFRTTLMRHNALTMQLLMSSAIATSIGYCWTTRQSPPSRFFALLAVGLGIATLLITRLGNVPINLVVKTWHSASPPANWHAILDRWDVLHMYRTGSAIGSFVCLLIADSLKQTVLSGKSADNRVASTASHRLV